MFLKNIKIKKTRFWRIRFMSSSSNPALAALRRRPASLRGILFRGTAASAFGWTRTGIFRSTEISTLLFCPPK